MNIRYYRLTELDVLMGPMTASVLTEVANREDQLHLAIRSYITDNTAMMWEADEVQPTEPINYEDQPYELGLSGVIHSTLQDVIDVTIEIDWPTEWIVQVELNGSEDQDEIDELIQAELDKHLPIQIKTTINQ